MTEALEFTYFDVHCCAVLNEGFLHGVAGIDVIVNTDDAASAIRRRLIDANVASVPLACQLNQVKTICIILWLTATVLVLNKCVLYCQ